jgi:hypothetical protein
MSIVDPRFISFEEVSNEKLIQIAQENNIRPDAVVVKTAIGGGVWIDPVRTDLVAQYQSGKLRGDEPSQDGIFYRVEPTERRRVPFISIQEKPAPTIFVSPSAEFITIAIGIHELPQPAQSNIEISLDIRPEIPNFSSVNIDLPTHLELKPIEIPLKSTITSVIQDLLKNKIENYFDQDRVGKTLLNFGNDFQSLILNWKYDTDPNNILVKLYRPLPTEIDELTELWIVRELAPTYLDQIFGMFVPTPAPKLYLRPPNRSISVNGLSGIEVNNVSMENLLSTGSFSPTNLTDPVLQEWYITSLEGAELNIDYSNFNEFVFYSSAVKRLNAFKNKMSLLENYNQVISEQSSSIAAANSGLSNFTGSLAFAGYQRLSEQRVDLFRSFDGYERFLYYGSASAYSASFTDESEDQLYYLSDATWPKINGQTISVASASSAILFPISTSSISPLGNFTSSVSWIDAMTFIATEYDKQNKNRLVHNLPEYIRNDANSEEFTTFVDLVGHTLDTPKMYADRMKDIFNRDSDPEKGLSPDLVWNIASSFGIDLPNQYAVQQLVDYTIGETSVVDSSTYRKAAAETWKRFLHNQIYLLKSKGTAASLRGLLNTYGVLPTTIQIRESSTPSFYISQSYELIEEQTNTLEMNGSSFISIPFSGSGITAPESIQMRFSSTTATQSVLFNVGNAWSVTLQPLTGSYGRVTLVSGSTAVASSSLFSVYGGDYFSVTVKRQTNTIANLYVYRIDEDGDIVDSSTSTGSLGTWLSGSILYLGSSGSTLGVPFTGLIDEFRMWTERLTDNTIQLHAKYPGLYNGETETSARDNLPVRLSFGRPSNLASASFISNESPYIRQSSHPIIFNQFSASGFSNETEYPYNMNTITRNVLRFAPNAGGSQFVSNKITIADPPILRYLTDDSGSGIPVLSHENSIVSLNQKSDGVKSNNIVGFYFSISDAINDSIIRSIGNIDLQDYIGNPRDLYQNSYSDLVTLNKIYWNNYAYSYNYNSFVDFVRTLLYPLFEHAKKLVPARAKLLTGLVLESPILERNKIKWNKIDMTGIGTYAADDNPTLYAPSITSQPEVIESTFPVYEATVDTSENTELDFSVSNLTTTVDTQTDIEFDSSLPIYETYISPLSGSDISGNNLGYETDLDLQENNIVEFEVISIDDETARFAYLNTLLTRFNIPSTIQISDSYKSIFNQLLTTFRPKSSIGVRTGLNLDAGTNPFEDTIEPYIDFLDLSNVTYFTQRDGLFIIPSTRQVKIGENILSSAGTWTKGSTYVKNQFVTQLNQTGSSVDGNDYEYVCITSPSAEAFISYNPPSIDTDNWRKVRYQTVPSITLKVATLVDGQVQLAASGSGYTPYTGYTSKHYRFHRDTHLATQRRLWLGCKQSDDTTFDGQPAVEIIPTTGHILVVSDGTEPIQRTNDSAGPILNVR